MGRVFDDFEGCYGEFVTEGTIAELGAVPLCVAPGETCVEHSHEGVEELMIVKSGRGQFEIEDEWFEVCPGSVGLVRSGEFHAVHNTGDENLEILAVVNANIDFDTVRVKSRAEHFAGKNGRADIAQGELTDLKRRLASVTELLHGVRDEVANLRKAAKPKRPRSSRAA